MNVVCLVGNLTRDIEVKFTASGTAVASGSLAMNEKVKRGEEWVDEPIYVDLTFWGRQAEVAGEYLAKGSKISVEGKLKLDQWEDKQTGDKRSKLGVKVVGFNMLSPKSDSSSKSSPQPSPKKVEKVEEDDDNDVPF